MSRRRHESELNRLHAHYSDRIARLLPDAERAAAARTAAAIERRADAFDIDADYVDPQQPGHRTVGELTPTARRVCADELRTVARDAGRWP